MAVTIRFIEIESWDLSWGTNTIDHVLLRFVNFINLLMIDDYLDGAMGNRVKYQIRQHKYFNCKIRWLLIKKESQKAKPTSWRPSPPRDWSVFNGPFSLDKWQTTTTTSRRKKLNIKITRPKYNCPFKNKVNQQS